MGARALAILLVLFGVTTCSSNSGPATGSQNGSCYPNNTCDAGLVCANGLCVLRPADARGIEAVTRADATAADAVVDAVVGDRPQLADRSFLSDAPKDGPPSKKDLPAKDQKPGEPLPVICAPNKPYCTTTSKLALCNATGTGPIGLELDCQKTQHANCNPTTGACYTCTPNKPYCVSATAWKACNAQGTGDAGFGMDCNAMYGTPCNWDTGECFLCNPGKTYCVSQTHRKMCNNDGTGGVGLPLFCPGVGCIPQTGSCAACVQENGYCTKAEDCCSGMACTNYACKNPCGGLGTICGVGHCCQSGLLCKELSVSGTKRCCHPLFATCTTKLDCCGAADCVAGICRQASDRKCLTLEDCELDEVGERYCHRPYPTAYGTCCKVGGGCLTAAPCCTWVGLWCSANGKCEKI